MKQITRAFLSAAIFFGIFLGCGFSVHASESNENSSLENLSYTVLSNGTISITDCSQNAMGTITIPEKIDGRTVTSIGEDAFGDCSLIQKIIIPDSVTTIEKSAFRACHRLNSINLPDRLTKINSSVFAVCSNLKNIVLPKNLSSIESSAFYNCKSLTDITIPENVSSIGSSAFSYCESLKAIDLPKKMQHLGIYTFSYCSQLTDITIPKGITEIGECTFYGCYNLKSINLPEGLLKIKSEAFSECESLKKITFPDTLSEIGWFSFCGTSLTDVVIPKSVSFINEYAFKCDNLSVVTILNPGCTIYDSPSTIGASAKILGYPGSTAQSYSKKYNRSFKSIIQGSPSPVTLSSKNVTLSSTTYIYNGKVKTPSVKIKNNAGKTLKKGIDYTVSYQKGRKNVQKYTVTISFIGSYGGTVKKIFTIVPKTSKIISIKAKRKQLFIKWKKQSVQTNGYQLQYSSQRTFKTFKTLNIKKASVTAKKISGLAKKKRYYVRIRTFKTIKTNGRTAKIYGKWSAAKSLKTK